MSNEVIFCPKCKKRTRHTHQGSGAYRCNVCGEIVFIYLERDGVR
jgi:ribosomal protein L37AE/L43A